MAEVVEGLRPYVLGWKAYFRLSQTPKVWRTLDEWMRHRLRAIQLKHWKRGKTMCRELKALGASETVACRVVWQGRSHNGCPLCRFTRRGSWKGIVSRAQPSNQASSRPLSTLPIRTMSASSPKPMPSARIAPGGQIPPGKDQKTFNTLIKKIEARRATLADWDKAIPLFGRKYASDLLPLQEKEMDLQFRLAQALDLAHGQEGLTKGEKRKLTATIVDLAEAVLGQKEHGELKALYNKHSQSDFDAEESARQEDMKSMLEAILDMDLGGVNMDSPEEILKRVETRYRAREEEGLEKKARRKKSPREKEREARLEGEQKLMSQSIREVYRKLASSLHPDREPDAAEKRRKTELMQRANQAYEKGDLLQLLELQLQLEQIDQTHLAAVGPERLKHYIKILKGQLGELDMEIQRVETGFAAQFGLPPFQRYDPKDLMAILHEDMAACEAAIRQLQEDLQAAGDLKRLKAWLKTVLLRRQRDRDLDWPF